MNEQEPNLKIIIDELREILDVSDEKENVPEGVNRDYLRGVSTLAKDILKMLKDFEAKLLQGCDHCKFIAHKYNKFVECEYIQITKTIPPFAYIECRTVTMKELLGK